MIFDEAHNIATNKTNSFRDSFTHITKFSFRFTPLVIMSATLTKEVIEILEFESFVQVPRITTALHEKIIETSHDRPNIYLNFGELQSRLFGDRGVYSTIVRSSR